MLTEDWKKEGGRLVIKIGREGGWKTEREKKNRLCFTARLVGTEEEVGERQKIGCVRSKEW